MRKHSDIYYENLIDSLQIRPLVNIWNQACEKVKKYRLDKTIYIAACLISIVGVKIYHFYIFKPLWQEFRALRTEADFRDADGVLQAERITDTDYYHDRLFHLRENKRRYPSAKEEPLAILDILNLLYSYDFATVDFNLLSHFDYSLKTVRPVRINAIGAFDEIIDFLDELRDRMYISLPGVIEVNAHDDMAELYIMLYLPIDNRQARYAENTNENTELKNPFRFGDEKDAELVLDL